MLAWQRYFYKTCCSCVTNSSPEERDLPGVEIPAEEVFPVLKENILEDGFHAVIDLEKSHDAVIVDALKGKEYLDCYGYFATLPVGHSHPKLGTKDFGSP